MRWLPIAIATENPNILFILADDLGYGDIACYNPKSKIPTPHIDQLATDGMRFTDAHSPSTVCTPTRYKPYDRTHGLLHRIQRSLHRRGRTEHD
jgi:hypothetical protein